jgi:lipopolysaccharide transport system permease protein
MIVNGTRPQEDSRTPVIEISPPSGWAPVNLREMWAYRELLFFFTWRDIKVRYKQTVFGFAWAIIQPLFMMMVFTLFFGQLAQVPSEGIPYPLFSYAALLPWTLFSESLGRASNSLINDTNLIQKVYFPRIITPLSSILSPLIDFAVAFLVLVGLMIYYHYAPTVMILWLPLLIILQMMLAFGMGLWLSAINVEYRDVRYAVPFLIQLWLFASPVIYSSSFVPPRFQAAYGIINPMSGIIEGFRWAILGTSPPSYLQLVTSTIIIIVILITGAFYFRRKESAFADNI